MIYTSTSNGQHIVLAPGATFDLVLPENPTTGFRWSLESGGGPACELLSEDLDPTPAKTPGGGTNRRWRFMAASGEGLIRLELKRQSEKTPVDTFMLRVAVR